MPFAVYEALPYLYFVLGAASLLGIEDIFRRLCGVTLIIIAWVIRKKRIRYRRGLAIDVVTVSKSW